MFVRTKGRAVLNARVKAIKKELISVDHDIRTLAETVQDSVDTGTILRARQRVAGSTSVRNDSRHNSVSAFAGRDSEQAVKTMGRRIRDERFSQYLSSSFNPTHSLKHERSVQRNKAIVMSCVVIAVFVWGLFRFLL